MKSGLEALIVEKALALGYESCGIVKVEDMADYEEKLKERIEAHPQSAPMLSPLFKYATPQKNVDWAKSIVVCVTRYGQYTMPAHLEGMIGKYYLYDYKLQTSSKGFAAAAELERFMGELGLQTTRELHGVTAMRLAAQKAGLGIIRKNNFFYTKNGSWVLLDTWLTDGDLESIEKCDLPPCPDGCRKCMDACPTQALASPYSTDMASCVTRLTWGLRDLPSAELREQAGKWVYGCDQCQNACPFNKGCWEETYEYPLLQELSEQISLEKILQMDDETIAKLLVPRFFFIRPEFIWLWKANAVRAMANSFEPKYEQHIRRALNDKDEKVREMAAWAMEKVGLERAGS